MCPNSPRESSRRCILIHECEKTIQSPKCGFGDLFPITIVHVIGNLLASCGSFSGSYNLKACLKISNHSDDVNKHCVCVCVCECEEILI